MSFKLFCSECGSSEVDYCDVTENGFVRCDSCRLVDRINDALNEAPELFFAALIEMAAPYRSWAEGAIETLICEAAQAAVRGDLDEARHLLRLAGRPKWSSTEKCQAAYDAAMEAKRGVAS